MVQEYYMKAQGQLFVLWIKIKYKIKLDWNKGKFTNIFANRGITIIFMIQQC